MFLMHYIRTGVIRKQSRPASKVFEIIKENSGSQFDPNLTEIFLELQREITDISE